MNGQLRKICIRNFSQELLELDFSYSIFEQRFIFRFLLLILIIALEIFAGFCAGIVGVYINRIIFFLDNPDIGLSLGLGSTVVIVVCLIEMTRLGVIAGLWKAILASLITASWIALQFRDVNLIFLFFFILFPIISTLLAFVSSNLSFELIVTSFRQKRIYLRILGLTSIIAISIKACDYWSGSSISNFKSFDSYFGTIKVVIGFLTGILIASTSWIITNRWVSYTKKHTFLKGWSIALASWGGTSFYNLDLSEIDFSGSRLANCDFRARKLYRTRLKGVTGLERARVDNRYLDLDQPKVQQLLTHSYSDETDFSHVNLQGAYLQDAIMQRFDLTEANLNGADLQGADLRDSILLRSQANGVNFSGANLTGICIQDWSVNSETHFSGVQCDYVYREYRDDRPTDRYPSDRNFKPGEFESLFQKITNAVELVFQEQIDWRALSFTFEKFRVEDDGMGLELKGIEQRGDYWIVKVTHGEGVSKQQVEQQVHSTYEELRALLESKDKQINQLLGIVDNQTKAMYQQAEALTNFSKQPLGNSFFISGSTITNLAGSGQIEYTEAAHQVRSLITNQSNPNQTLQQLLTQLSQQKVAVTAATQTELIQQVILSEAERDPAFKQFLLQHQQQITNCLPSEDIAIAVQAAISALRQP